MRVNEIQATHLVNTQINVILAGADNQGAVSASSRVGAEKTESDENISPKSLSILVVDDDNSITKFLKGILLTKSEDLQVYESNDGFDAGIKLRELLPDIVFVDLMMPGLGGLELCESIKSTPELSHIRVIAMTGYSSDESINQVLAAGAEACLSKPFQSDEMFKLLGLIEPD